MTETALPRLGRIALFATLFLALQAAWWQLGEGEAGDWLIGRATVAPSAALIGWLFPHDHVWAQGPRLAWPDGRMQLEAGCDGFEVLALFIPAVLVAPIGWRRGVAMLLAGTALIWCLNQARLLALYLAFRRWHEAFDPLHAVWAPLLVLGATFAFYAWCLRCAR